MQIEDQGKGAEASENDLGARYPPETAGQQHQKTFTTNIFYVILLCGVRILDGLYIWLTSPALVCVSASFYGRAENRCKPYI
jgi:hypothetical protein